MNSRDPWQDQVAYWRAFVFGRWKNHWRIRSWRNQFLFEHSHSFKCCPDMQYLKVLESNISRITANLKIITIQIGWLRMILGTSPSITVNHPKKLAYKMRARPHECQGWRGWAWRCWGVTHSTAGTTPGGKKTTETKLLEQRSGWVRVGGWVGEAVLWTVLCYFYWLSVVWCMEMFYNQTPVVAIRTCQRWPPTVNSPWKIGLIKWRTKWVL